MIKFITAAVFSLAIAGTAHAQNAPGAHFLENWDLNEDGIVSLEDATERRGDIFAMFDQDDDGVLSAQEYELFDDTREADAKLNAGGHGNGNGKGKGGFDRAQDGLTMTFNDLDENGSVTKDEFVSRTADWLTMIDRDGDGKVTMADFGPRN